MAFFLWANLLTLVSLAPATRTQAFFLSAASQSSNDWDLNFPVHFPNLSLLPLGLGLLDKVQFLSMLYRAFLWCGPWPTLFNCKSSILRQVVATTEILDYFNHLQICLVIFTPMSLFLGEFPCLEEHSYPSLPCLFSFILRGSAQMPASLRRVSQPCFVPALCLVPLAQCSAHFYGPSVFPVRQLQAFSTFVASTF